jgi:hypothetical protein
MVSTFAVANSNFRSASLGPRQICPHIEAWLGQGETCGPTDFIGTSVIGIEMIVLDSILPQPIHCELLAKVQTQFSRAGPWASWRRKSCQENLTRSLADRSEPCCRSLHCWSRQRCPDDRQEGNKAPRHSLGVDRPKPWRLSFVEKLTKLFNVNEPSGIFQSDRHTHSALAHRFSAANGLSPCRRNADATISSVGMWKSDSLPSREAPHS